MDAWTIFKKTEIDVFHKIKDKFDFTKDLKRTSQYTAYDFYTRTSNNIIEVKTHTKYTFEEYKKKNYIPFLKNVKLQSLLDISERNNIDLIVCYVFKDKMIFINYNKIDKSLLRFRNLNLEYTTADLEFDRYLNTDKFNRIGELVSTPCTFFDLNNHIFLQIDYNYNLNEILKIEL